MKKYFFVVFFYNFVSIFLFDDIYDINFSNEYVYRNLFTEYCHFRMKIEDIFNLKIKLTIPKGANVNYNIGFTGFSSYPDDDQIISSYDSHYFFTEYIKLSDSSYDKYIYSFSVNDIARYIDILLVINSKFDYLSIKVFPEPSIIKYALYNISYNNIYELNNTGLINNEGGFLFKLKNDNEENGIIKLNIDKRAYPDKEMELEIFGYEEEPITREDLAYNYLKELKLKLDSKYTDEKYSKYGYLYEKIEKAKYLVIAVSIKKNMNYFSIHIGPRNSDEQGGKSEKEGKSEEKGASKDNNNYNESTISTPLIILLLVLYTIVILFVFYFILRKLGYSRKDNISSHMIQDFNLQQKN